MLLPATNLGLGSIYLTSFLSSIINNNDLLSELGISKEYIPISAVGVGYSDISIEQRNLKDIQNRICIVRR